MFLLSFCSFYVPFLLPGASRAMGALGHLRRVVRRGGRGPAAHARDPERAHARHHRGRARYHTQAYIIQVSCVLSLGGLTSRSGSLVVTASLVSLSRLSAVP